MLNVDLTSIYLKNRLTLWAQILCVCVCVYLMLLLLCSETLVLPHTLSWSKLSENAILTENCMSSEKFAFSCILFSFIQHVRVI